MAKKNIKENFPLKILNTWRVGGNAQFYANAYSTEIPSLVTFAKERMLSITVLGRGSNSLISDAGIEGLVINLRDADQAPRFLGDFFEVDAGFPMPKLARRLAKEGYGGFEFMVGIPGTVGGGIAMNAGTHAYRKREIQDVLEWADIITHNGEYLRVTATEMAFGFRSSAVLRNSWIVIGACFRLEEREDPVLVQQRTLEHLEERKRKQPLTVPTAGSTFKNPSGALSAGWYIEQIGLKGFRLGGCKISEKHANWVENTGTATATDIFRLIRRIQMEVASKYSVDLEPEVQMLGTFSKLV